MFKGASIFKVGVSWVGKRQVM